MLLKYAETFRDVASLRSFSQAAKARGQSQPAVSHAIHQLEDYLGVTLFDRSTRPLELTAAGEVYFEGCQSLLDQFLQLEDQVRGLGSKTAGSVKVAAIYSVGLLEMSVIVAEFEQRFPEVEVRIQYSHPDKVYSLVRENEVDIGIVAFPRPCSDWESTLWRTQDMAIIVPAGHEWVGRTSVTLEEVADRDFIALTPDLSTRTEIDRAVKLAGASLRIVHEFDNIDTVSRVVGDRAGISILPVPAIQRELSAGSVVAIAIADGPLTRPLSLIKRRSGSPSRAAEALFETIRDSPRTEVSVEPRTELQDADIGFERSPDRQSTRPGDDIEGRES